MLRDGLAAEEFRLPGISGERVRLFTITANHQADDHDLHGIVLLLMVVYAPPTKQDRVNFFKDTLIPALASAVDFPTHII